MNLSRRFLLIAWGLSAIASGVSVNRGFYSPLAIVLVMFGSVLVICACFTAEQPLRTGPAVRRALLLAPLAFIGVVAVLSGLRSTDLLSSLLSVLVALLALLALLWALWRRHYPEDPLLAMLAGLGILLAGLSVLASASGQLLYATSVSALLAIIVLLVVAFSVWLTMPAATRHDTSRGWRMRFTLLLLVGAGVRVLAVIASPDPLIDVNTWLQTAPRYLLAGHNPYATDYPSPYDTPQAKQRHIYQAAEPRPATYPPLAILTGLPAAALGFDARYLNVLGDVLAAILLFAAGLRSQRRGVGVLCAGIYLCLPRAPFLIEQAWFEPQLAALIGAFLFWAPSCVLGAGLALGGFLAAKQFGLLLLLPILRSCWRHKRLLAVSVATAALLVLPFFLWSPADFWQIVAAKHFARPVAPNGLTLTALLMATTGWQPPQMLMLAIAAALISALIWRTPRVGEGALGLWLGAVLLVFVLCHKQGYFNYYILAVYLLLFGLAQDAASSGGDS